QPRVGLPGRVDTHWNARYGLADHAEDVAVEIVRLHHVNATLGKQMREAAKLPNHVGIVKTVQPIFGNLRKSHSLNFVAQRAAAVETREMDIVSPALFQQTRKLHRMRLG